MNAKKLIREIGWKVALVLLLAMLAFQSSGLNGLAAGEATPLQPQAGASGSLTCGCLSVKHQILLLIDDSGSMQKNDPGSNRNQVAKDLIKQLNTVEDTQVAVIHFNHEIVKDPDVRTSTWLPVDSSDLVKAIGPIPGFKYTKMGTNFEAAFTEARKVFEQSGLDYCTRRSIVLLSDGTPEDLNGILSGVNLTQAFDNIRKLREGIARLDGMYVFGYKTSTKYFSEAVQSSWRQLITNLKLYPSKNPKNDINEIVNDQNEEKDLTRLSVILNATPKYLQQNQQSNITVTIALQGDDHQLPLNFANFSITPLDQKEPVPLTQDGNLYQISWAPVTLDDGQFNVKTDLVDANDPKKIVLNCTGAFELPVVKGPTFDGISLVIMPPREVAKKDQPVVLPMRLNYDGEIKSVNWRDAQASVLARNGQSVSGEPPLIARVEPDASNNREAKLIVDPIDGQGQVEIEIVASVGAKVGVGTQEDVINIPDSPSNIVIPTSIQVCEYDIAWNAWFWPLAIVLAALLILLAVIRIRDGRTQKDYQHARQDSIRIRKWRFLFVPFLVLLSFLVLNRLWWCYIIPWWMFLGSMLGLLVIVFPLVYFVREERHQAWVLLALLLIAISLVAVLSITIDRRLLWPLLTLLLLTVLGRWYIRPDEPTDPRPENDWSVAISLTSTPRCVPYNKSITLPIHLDYKGEGPLPALPTWTPWVEVLPEGEVAAKIVAVKGERDAYEVRIDPVRYDKKTTQFQVQVHAQAILTDEHPIEIPEAMTTITLCPPDPLAELEGIGESVRDILYANQILYFKQLAGEDVDKINGLLDAEGLNMMDAKTWPQQAKLAAIAREFGAQDQKIYEAYKGWLKDGIEPDEYDKDEKDRRTAPALFWNGIPQFTPLVLSLAISPSSAYRDEAIVLPVRLNREADRIQLAAAKWKVNAKAMPGGEDVQATVRTAREDPGTQELVIGPVQNRDTREIQVSVQALVNGRSIEIYYGKAISVHVSPAPLADDLADLEGIGEATQRILNEKGVFTFEQLARMDHNVINEWLNEADLRMMDAKTWPQQARLADVAKKYGREDDQVDQRSYQAYKTWLKDGIEPDEYEKDEKDRRQTALTWYGTAELTKKAYPEIFKKQ